MSSGALKFAVVREDPWIEVALVEAFGVEAVLLAASGGCTALTLASRFGSLEVTAFDFNPRQLAHVREKIEVVASGDVGRLGVGVEGGLNQGGEFEGLFRVLRHFVEEFVAPPEEIEGYFRGRDGGRAGAWMASKYWPTAFELAFSDALLLAMFGPEAVQHAAPGSYPGYFQGVFERGLRREDGPRNPFLQHVFLGRYLPEDAPEYVTAGRALDVSLVEGGLLEVPDLDRFGLISLSNIFDWSDDGLVASWAGVLRAQVRPGAVVVVRQLNNTRDIRGFFGPGFEFDGGLGRRLQEADRSLFYNRIEVGRRVERG